ncbi:DUF647-domain-containing protein [Wolfiporia cocos MD-104 SS10]|uniref:DUF647-domain-containing protein n=1 Tax=Wolfiporia cocos (strain MD-104) TaxID=742152 RepID=A0A2H3JB33_WOLCO|nr:DUF647-domain-containing protein [Wolfiporia cocos MD-104 SS10]
MYCYALRAHGLLVSRGLTLQAATARIASRRHYQSSRTQKQVIIDSPRLEDIGSDPGDKPRPFAIERIGGRECHISWAEKGVTKEWRDLPGVSDNQGKIQASSTTGSLGGRLSSWIRQMFLPTNYPQSVHRSYMPFHILQFFETVFGTVVSVLCNQALLTSVGVSAEGSIFGAVAVQWIIKDGAGEVAKLFFIRKYAPYFDSHPKSFDLFGECIVALGSGLQIATLLVTPTPGNFLLCAAGGNVFKLVGYAVWFTTHIKFVRYFSQQGNVGDVAAKDESQTSIAQLAGYAAGIGLLTFSHSPAYLYSLFFLLTPAHLTTTVFMMRVATFESLTVPRLSLLARGYAAERDDAIVPFKELEKMGQTGLFGEFYKMKRDEVVSLAPRVADVIGAETNSESMRWELCTNVFRNDKYLLYPQTSVSKPILVFYHPDATTDDFICSVVNAARLRHLLSDPSQPTFRSCLTGSHVWTQSHFPSFKAALEEKGWRTDEIGFADHGHRVLWGPETERKT